MASIPEHEQIKNAMVQALVLLCKNCLKFEHGFVIDGLLRVTIDKDLIVHIDVKENVVSVSNNNAHVSGSQSSASRLQPDRKRVYPFVNNGEVQVSFLGGGDENVIKAAKYETASELLSRLQAGATFEPQSSTSEEIQADAESESSEPDETDMSQSVLDSVKEQLESTVPADIKQNIDKKAFRTKTVRAMKRGANDDIITVNDGVAYVSSVNVHTSSVPVELNALSGCFEPVIRPAPPQKKVRPKILPMKQTNNLLAWTKSGGDGKVIILGTTDSVNASTDAVLPQDQANIVSPVSQDDTFAALRSLLSAKTPIVKPKPTPPALQSILKPNFKGGKDFKQPYNISVNVKMNSPAKTISCPGLSRSLVESASKCKVSLRDIAGDADNQPVDLYKNVSGNTNTAAQTQPPIPPQDYVWYVKPPDYIEIKPKVAASHAAREHDHDYTSTDGCRPKVFTCRKCSHKFQAEAALKKHTRYCTKMRPVFKCPFCSIRFTRKLNLKAHLRLLHDGKIWSAMKEDIPQVLHKEKKVCVVYS